MVSKSKMGTPGYVPIFHLAVDGRKVPGGRVTKAEVIEYYIRISDVARG